MGGGLPGRRAGQRARCRTSAGRGDDVLKPSTSLPVVVLGSHHGVLGIARSLGRWGVPVYALDRDLQAPALRSRYVRERLPIDLRAPAAETIGRLDDLGRRLGQAILLPTTDDTALLVAEHAGALSERFRFPRVSPELIRSFSDKKALFFLAQQLHVPTAGASFPASVADVRRYIERAVFPVMLKGIDGTRLQARTGKKMVIVQSAGELLRWYQALEDPEHPNLMLQEYIPGGDDTIWMFNGYFDARSQCLAAFTGRKLRQHPVHTGATSLGIQEANTAVAEMTIAFMQAAGYRGILDIGYRFDARDGQYKLLDPNPRIGQTFRLFVDQAGLDVARCLYLDLTGQPVPAVHPREGRKWLVEDKDLESSLEYRGEGQLSIGSWLRSFKGVEEGAWFARDDLRPFAAMAGRLAGRVGRRAGRTVAQALWHAPRRWWGFAVNRRIQALIGRAAFALGLHRRVFQDRAVVLCFHRVDDDASRRDFLSCGRDAFRSYCDFLARHFTIVSLGELVTRLARGEPVGGTVALTFDDGYRDNAAVVAPELKQRGLPATFFVATELVGTDFVPSWDAKCGVRTQWMSWDDVRHLRRQGFEVGSHTMHHIDLGTASPSQARRELECSRERLERELGEPVTLFSYPFGRAENMNETNRALVREAGYACCASANGGMITPSTDPYRLARISVTPWHRFPAQLGFDLLRAARS